jgi:TrmH family RNA methyltransferase
MLTKAQIKYIRSLAKQKIRNENKVFIAEGGKIATEWLLSGTAINMIIGTREWVAENGELIARHPEAELHVAKDSELESISSLHTPNGVLLVAPIPEKGTIPLLQEWYIALDDVQDPGNMGTIIRIADWFGIRNIVCSPGCADIYNQKVVQSAMGGHLRVNMYESNLEPFLSSISIPKIAASLNGLPVYGMERMEAGVLIIGNESKGISEGVLACADRKVTIPRKGGAESLNAGVSAGILCALLLPC